MRIKFLHILLGLMFVLPLSVYAQQWNLRLSVDSEVGYSTNSYLNEYLWEWEPSVSAPYWIITPNVQASRYIGQNAFSFSGGVFYQPYLQSGFGDWHGFNGNFDFNRRWTRKLFTGIQIGGNRYKSTYIRSLGWIEPYLQWHLTENMEFAIKWNSTFRNYDNLPVDTSSSRYDRLILNYRWWPSYKWRLRTGINGNITEIQEEQEALSGYIGTDYWFRNGARISLTAGFERYGFEETIKRSIGPRCDVKVGCVIDNTVYITNQDDIYRIKVSGMYPLNPRWSVNITSAYLKWNSNGVESAHSVEDVLFSAGISYSITPSLGGRESIRTPSIKKKEDRGKTLFKIKYKGEGKLYITGDFNNWQRPGIPLIKGPNYSYRTTLDLDKGVYEYKVLKVEGGKTEWLKLGDATAMVKDGFGGMNGRMIIQ